MTNPKEAICARPSSHNCGSDNIWPSGTGLWTGIGACGVKAIQIAAAMPARAAVEKNAPRQPSPAESSGTAKITNPDPRKTEPP